MNEQIKNIISDWGGVLIDLNLEGCISAFEQAGAVNVRDLLTGTNELGFFRDYECGKISTPEFREAIRKHINKPLTDEEIDRMWNMELLTIPEEKLLLLAELSKHYRLFLLSNTNELHWEYGYKNAFCRNGKDYTMYFERIFLSYRMHLSKPDPAIFQRVLQEAGLQPAETLFIDDAETNCLAAASTGMQAAHYIPGTDLGELSK